jgi:hypothetical protein
MLPACQRLLTLLRDDTAGPLGPTTRRLQVEGCDEETPAAAEPRRHAVAQAAGQGAPVPPGYLASRSGRCRVSVSWRCHRDDRQTPPLHNRGRDDPSQLRNDRKAPCQALRPPWSRQVVQPRLSAWGARDSLLSARVGTGSIIRPADADDERVDGSDGRGGTPRCKAFHRRRDQPLRRDTGKEELRRLGGPASRDLARRDASTKMSLGSVDKGEARQETTESALSAHLGR